MTTHILIIAHAPLAHALRECALHVFPECEDEVLALEDGDVQREGILEDSAPSPLERMEQQEEVERVLEGLSGLPERERLLVSLYYYEGLTLKEIGESLGLTRERVRQIENEALGKLSASLQAD